MKNSKSLLTIAPLFLIIALDSMGLGLIFPILNSIIIDPHSTFLSSADSARWRDFLFGFTISIFMLCWFFGATILGDLSDKIGRKKGLLISLLGAACGYLLSGIAISISSFSLLILGRVIAGFTAGSQPIAQAAIIDISNEESKTRNIALMLLFSSVGFVIGPLLGGILSDKQLVHWFSFSTPMYFSTLISLLNALLLIAFFKETFHKTGKIKLHFHRAIHIFLSAFKHAKIRRLSIVLLFLVFGWSNYYSYISMFVLNRFQFTPLDVSLFLAIMSVGFTLGFAVLVNVLAKYFPLKKTIVVTLLISALSILLTTFSYKPIYAILLTVVIGLAMAVAWSNIINLFSNQVGPEQQGWIMGVTGSIMALCFGLSTLFTGFAARLSITVPLWLGAIGLFISAFIMIFLETGASSITETKSREFSRK